MRYHLNSIRTDKVIKNKFIRYFNELIAEKVSNTKYESITIACIGSDRSTGDSLGPIVGSLLEELNLENINIVGTLEFPLHAKNLADRLEFISENSLIIAVDACLGNLENVSCISINNEPISPGAAVNKELPNVGELSVTGIVNISQGFEFMVLQNTRLNTVIELAKGITNILKEVIPAIDFGLYIEPEFVKEIVS